MTGVRTMFPNCLNLDVMTVVRTMLANYLNVDMMNAAVCTFNFEVTGVSKSKLLVLPSW